MSRPTHVYIVTSPRPRSGKTLLARALTEFFRTDGRPVGAFDLDTLDGTLAGFLPKFTVRADIADIRGQVALFDELIVDNEKPKIVDVSAQDRSGALDAFQRACIEAADQSAQVPVDAANPLVLKTADDPQVPDGTWCASDGCHVYAEISRVVQLPIPFPGFPGTITVRGTGYAAPVAGTNVATSTCTGIAWVPAPPPR